MQTFQALERNQKIHRHYLLEASAGTGKTFAIENVVVRLLIEAEPETLIPLTIDQILVVTFTRAATRELKARIRSNIEHALGYLLSSNIGDEAPDYLTAIIEKGAEAISQAKKNLERALFNFDQAQIHTLHGFCSKMLRDQVFEGNLSLDSSFAEVSTNETVRQVIYDYMRTELNREVVTPEQLSLIIPKSFDTFLDELGREVMKSSTILSATDLEMLIQDFNVAMRELKADPEEVFADCIALIPFFNKMYAKDEVNPEKGARHFADIMSKQKWDSSDLDLIIRDRFIIRLAEDNRKKNKKNLPLEQLNHPLLLGNIQRGLLSVIQRASDKSIIFTLIASGCQKMVRRFLEEEEIVTFDDLLKKMVHALENPDFLDEVRRLYRAAIIDEFQDTDPLQWTIFRRLFLDKADWGYLYIVGDPKQSIYGFRDADIYTYLSAAESMGADQMASLNTNYRSQKSLVEALNTLFSDLTVPRLIDLPRKNLFLPYLPVKCGGITEEKEFSDGRGAVHFFYAKTHEKGENLDNDYFFPFITQEIQRLCRDEGFSYNQCAVLVKDRFQAANMATFLNHWGVPCENQRATLIKESAAFPALYELLVGVLSPRHDSSLRIALGGKIIGWTHQQIKDLCHHDKLENVLIRFYALRKKLVNQGFAFFFQEMMHSRWHNDSMTVEEWLLSQDDGVEFYDDLQMLAGLLLEYQSSTQASAERLIAYLDEMKNSLDDDERYKRYPEPGRQAVHILTLHSSKGLEYDVVFALALASRSKALGALIPATRDGKRVLVPNSDDVAEERTQHCMEIDAEKCRQLYVAMTRAKHRLYVPIAKHAKSPAFGTAAPIELYLAKQGDVPCGTYDMLYDRIQNFDETSLCDLIQKYVSKNITVSKLNKGEFNLVSSSSKAELLTLHPPKVISIPGESLELYSFTTLSKGLKGSGSDIGVMPHDFASEIKSPHTLPAGSDTGNLLHGILETIPFHDLKKIKETITAAVERTPFAAWEPVIRQLIFDVVQKPLLSFSLNEVDPGLMYRETEFLYPISHDIAVEELHYSSGFLKGVIDLVFQHQGKYYILDWKSNWLGPDTSFYHQDNLIAAMREHHYYLQASVYKGALMRYLKIGNPRDFEEVFGGVIYVFLRGIDSSDGHHGILHF